MKEDTMDTDRGIEERLEMKEAIFAERELEIRGVALFFFEKNINF